METLQRERGRKARRKERRGHSRFEALAQKQNGLSGQMQVVGAQGLLGSRTKESEATASLSQVTFAGCYRRGWTSKALASSTQKMFVPSTPRRGTGDRKQRCQRPVRGKVGSEEGDRLCELLRVVGPRGGGALGLSRGHLRVRASE